jgi:hypothetical protein
MYQLHFKHEGGAKTHAHTTEEKTFFEFLQVHGLELWKKVTSIEIYSGITGKSIELKPANFLKRIGCQKLDLELAAKDLRGHGQKMLEVYAARGSKTIN